MAAVRQRRFAMGSANRQEPKEHTQMAQAAGQAYPQAQEEAARMTTTFAWGACLPLAASLCVAAAAGPASPCYRIRLRVDPEARRIEAAATVLHPQGTTLYLNEQLEVKRVTGGGADVPFVWDRSADPLPYTQRGRPVHLQVERLDELTIEYEGVLAEVENGVNMVTPDLVELAYYACWYPVFPGSPDFTFELQSDLPPRFTATTNGRRTRVDEGAGRGLATWESFAPVSDIAVVASPRFHSVASQQESLHVEVLYAALDSAAVAAKVQRLGQAMAEMRAFFGPPLVPGLLRFVYSPRPGWGYSRIPLFVVSEGYARSLAEEPFGEAREFHGAAHEMAHFWWMLADPSTPDDWINEGLAEYSAFRLSLVHFGTVFGDSLLAEYRAHAAAAPADLAIARTPSASEARYVNRYEKTAVMLTEAARRFGQEHVDQMLAALYTRFAPSRRATTEVFLEEVGSHLGDKARRYFEECLYRPGWQPHAAGRR
ncbi:MAG: hypothetical protein AB1505_09595 [Candidatus Latescibacterota bacterium]